LKDLDDSFLKKTKTKCFNCLGKCIVSKSSIFSYKNKHKQRWDIVMIICAIFNSALIPLEINFELPNLFNSVKYIVFDNAIDVLFVIDIIVMFFQSYLDTNSGIEVFEPKEVALNYIFSMGFLFDIFSVVGASVFTRLVWWLRPFGYFKMIRVRRLGRFIDRQNF
jgi:hypothetical protein